LKAVGDLSLAAFFVLIALKKSTQSLFRAAGGIRIKSDPPLTFAVESALGVINVPLHNGDFIGRHFYRPAGGTH